jgi:6-phosphogluconolactonase
MNGQRIVQQFQNAESLTAAAAEEFVRRSGSAIADRGRFTVALSGGSTPKYLFARLAHAACRERVAWDHVHFFWGDERAVPPDHPDSNYGLANRWLLSQIAPSMDNVHRIRAELGADDAATHYEEDLRDFFGLGTCGVPSLDVVFLGMGEDGHTASLFPGTEAVGERGRLVAANWVPTLGANRITMTLPVINRSACVLFLVSGEAKARVLQRVLEGEQPSADYPASLVHPAGDLLWFVDVAAGRLLSSAHR